MPQRNAPGGNSKKKKGRAPKHQNSFAFRHNPKSKKTEKILSSPNVGVCRRCYEKIEWRKKYRKYKPRTQPGKCNLCCHKNIMAAYHTICTNCAGSDRAIDDMEKRRKSSSNAVAAQPPSDTVAESTAAENNEVEEVEEDEPTSTNEDDDATSTTTPPTDDQQQTAIKRARRRLRVCAMCTSEPALSKHSYGDGEDEDLIEEIHLIEDKIEDGVTDDGKKKLTLREIKTLERKIEKLQLEMKERRRARNAKDEEEEEGNDDDDDEGEDNSNGGDGEEATESVQLGDAAEEQDDDDDDANDPFLLAVGGKDKLLVGEEYQKMLLARGQQQS